ncbi:hypothetical protein BDV98DRAFT_430604 [Pterulicium gracile]|uniref:Uncharacterized protein n=1 Tax=Pterulicium gracile TaxID=1884261 RepID=A0A5C3QKR1_9AGAR|nr:hypothetical protein BDV98DRAFT_430604 [Pterula gracilis]
MQYNSAHGFLLPFAEVARRLFPSIDVKVKERGGLFRKGGFRIHNNGVYSPLHLEGPVKSQCVAKT